MDTIKDFDRQADRWRRHPGSEGTAGRREGQHADPVPELHKEGNNTVIDVNTKGQLAAQGADQKIVLENVDLTQGGQLNNQAIINDLLQKGKLNVDHS